MRGHVATVSAEKGGERCAPVAGKWMACRNVGWNLIARKMIDRDDIGAPIGYQYAATTCVETAAIGGGIR
jgi:hypothetical protein